MYRHWMYVDVFWYSTRPPSLPFAPVSPFGPCCNTNDKALPLMLTAAVAPVLTEPIVIVGAGPVIADRATRFVHVEVPT
jgi:hypothetical protein